MEIVKGFVGIEKIGNESERAYKHRVINLLYTLLASYRGSSREIYLQSDDWKDSRNFSMLQEDPEDIMAENDILQDPEKRKKFFRHHVEHGWNKALKLDVLDAPHYEMSDEHYSEDGDFIHWIRKDEKDEGQVKHFDVYLLKFYEYPWIDKEGFMTRNGLLFAEKYCDKTYAKIKRVVSRLVGMLIDRKMPYSAIIGRPTLKETLRTTQDTQNLEWILTRKPE